MSAYGKDWQLQEAAREKAYKLQRKREKSRETIKFALGITMFFTVGGGGLVGLIFANMCIAFYLTPFLLIGSVPASIFVFIWAIMTVVDKFFDF